MAYPHGYRNSGNHARQEAERGTWNAQVAELQERVRILEQELRMVRATRKALATSVLVTGVAGN